MIFKNKRGDTSILIVGLMFFFFIIVVMILTMVLIKQDKFVGYAGMDAQRLTSAKYDIEKVEFSIERSADVYFRDRIKNKDLNTLFTGLSYQGPTGTPFLPLEKDGAPLYDYMEDRYDEWLVEDFKSYFDRFGRDFDYIHYYTMLNESNFSLFKGDSSYVGLFRGSDVGNDDFSAVRNVSLASRGQVYYRPNFRVTLDSDKSFDSFLVEFKEVRNFVELNCEAANNLQLPFKYELVIEPKLPDKILVSLSSTFTRTPFGVQFECDGDGNAPYSGSGLGGGSYNSLPSSSSAGSPSSGASSGTEVAEEKGGSGDYDSGAYEDFGSEYYEEGVAAIDENLLLFDIKEFFRKKSPDEIKCMEGFAERQAKISLPEEICYWDTMKELYDQKCDNLDSDDIEHIFDTKELYRDENFTEWPNLNSDEDFCVPIFYDCKSWYAVAKSDSTRSAEGFMSYDSTELGLGKVRHIQFNPNNDYKSEWLEQVLLHEGLHSIQPHDGIRLGSGKYRGDAEKKSRKQEAENIISSQIVPFLDYLSDYSETKLSEDVTGDLGILSALRRANSTSSFIKRYMDAPVGAVVYYPYEFKADMLNLNTYLTSAGVMTEGIRKKMNETILLQQEAYEKLNYHVLDYIANRQEVEVRLSEVHRWWLDESAPNCEAIYTSERFEDVFKSFLYNISSTSQYSTTSFELRRLVESYKDTVYEEVIWNSIIERGPGLVYDFDDSGILADTQIA